MLVFREPANSDTPVTLYPLSLGLLRTFWAGAIFGTRSPKHDLFIFENDATLGIFEKLLPRPNRYASQICVEILCRDPVSKFRKLSYESKSSMKTPNIVP